MSIVLCLTVFIGFGSTYYLRFFDGGPTATLSGGPFTTLVHVHAALFSTWVLGFIVQMGLVARRRVAVHRRLGMVMGGLAAATTLVQRPVDTRPRRNCVRRVKILTFGLAKDRDLPPGSS